MMKMLIFKYLIVLTAILNGSEVYAVSSQENLCGTYFTSVFESNNTISSGLLQDEGLATDCLVQALKRLSQDIDSPQIEESKRGSLNRAVAALLRIVERGGQPAINKIRNKDDISVASVLSFCARNDNRETRLNCTGLLSNIIDNSTVCVPMDHLADPELLKSEWGVNGRANLIAVVSVVAPWAQKSNFNNMKNLVKFLTIQIEEQNDVQETKNLIKTLTDRLNYQDTISNPNKNTDTSIIDGCRKMPVRWAKTPQFTLTYEDNSSANP